MARKRGSYWTVGLALVGLACAGGEIGVREAFDVPPPPGARTLDLGPSGRFEGVRPGDVVTVNGLELSVLDQRVEADGAVVTVYVDERVAEGWLAEGSVARRSGCAPRESSGVR